MKQATQPHRAAYRLPQVADIVGLSRASIYRTIGRGELDLVKIGPRASGVTRDSLVNYLQQRGIPVPAGL